MSKLKNKFLDYCKSCDKDVMSKGYLLETYYSFKEGKPTNFYCPHCKSIIKTVTEKEMDKLKKEYIG